MAEQHFVQVLLFAVDARAAGPFPGPADETERIVSREQL